METQCCHVRGIGLLGTANRFAFQKDCYQQNKDQMELGEPGQGTSSVDFGKCPTPYFDPECARTSGQNKASYDKMANWEIFGFSSHFQNSLQVLKGKGILRRKKQKQVLLFTLSMQDRPHKAHRRPGIWEQVSKMLLRTWGQAAGFLTLCPASCPSVRGGFILFLQLSEARLKTLLAS